VVTCEGGLHSRPFVEQALGNWLATPQFLHSAYGGPASPEAPGQEFAYFLIFTGTDPDPDSPLVELRLDSEGGIIGLGQRCGAFPALLLEGRPVLAAPLGDP
jgi:hypothetical protein